ncbi:MAG: hypothetical protein NTZ74_00775 [Chloroflexi bacterium]|nr:hypothetical protein [Chloroflexota bacterium]
MKMKILRSFLGLIILALLISSCGKGADPGSEQLPQDQPAVGIGTEAPDAAEENLISAVEEGGRVEFPQNGTQWSDQGLLAPGTSRHYVLSVELGRQITVRLQTNLPPEEAAGAEINILSGDGTLLSSEPSLYWSGVLPSDQEISIDVQSNSAQELSFSLDVERSPIVIDPDSGALYAPLEISLCEDLQGIVNEAFEGVAFSLETPAPFFDPIAGEAGQGCRLSASGDGTVFSSPQDVIATLSGVLAWNDEPRYRADGPTGSFAAVSRDMGLMLLSVNWQPTEDTLCPNDQPIESCVLEGAQKEYELVLDLAEYQPGFSLDGHWVDNNTGDFSLDLFQDWKNIWGKHESVVRGGNKIDAMDPSITGVLNGRVVTLQFQSSFTEEPGTAEITYMDVNTIHWKIIDPPQGEFYLPLEIDLTRK